MFFKSIKIKNFSKKFRKSSSKNLILSFKKFIHSNNNILLSMKNNYKDSYNKKLILDLKKFKNVNLIGMGGSSLGAKQRHPVVRRMSKHRLQSRNKQPTLSRMHCSA